MFEQQYTEQWTTLDGIAERVRALGFKAPGSCGRFARQSSIEEVPASDEAPGWKAIVKQRVLDNEAVCRSARKVLADANDEPSADLLTQRRVVHEKYAWMLRSLLE